MGLVFRHRVFKPKDHSLSAIPVIFAIAAWPVYYPALS